MDIVAAGLLGHVVMAALVALDSAFPLVPSEAVVVAASAIGGPAATLGVGAAAALGALAGDVFVHVLGRRAHRTRLGRWLGRRRFVAGGPGVGAAVVVWGRFVPGGRTCVSFLSGATGMRWRTYLPAAAAGSVLWAVSVTALGRIGSRFGHQSARQHRHRHRARARARSAVALVVRIARRRRRSAPSRHGQLTMARGELATQDGGRGH